MKKRLQGIIAGVLIGTMLPSGIALAKQATETIRVTYDNIKILIDGKEYHPTDANGNTVEPFIYNGTTYLPVRAIANAFDKEVDWEAQTSTVTLGSKNYDWLDQMGYVDYKTTGMHNNFSAISEGTKMSDDTKYDRGLSFKINDHLNYGTLENNDGTLECSQQISFLLNGQYKTFDGIIADGPVGGTGTAQIKFYGDNELLYSSPIISNGMKSTKINLDVSNKKILKIYVEFVNPRGDKYSSYKVDPCIVDARLSKK